jgi:hypothetical protein
MVCNHTVTSPAALIVVIDSGATDTMTACKSLFEDITYYSDINNQIIPQVMMRDKHTYHPVKGYGWINYVLNGHRIRQMALYIPALGNTTLFSVKQHMQWAGTFFHAKDNKAVLAFPTFTIALDTNHEISTTIHSAVHSTAPIEFDESTALPSTGPSNKTTDISLVSQEIKCYIPTV